MEVSVGAVLAAAERLRTAHQTRRPTAPVRDLFVAGDVIMTGAMGPMVAIAPGDMMSVRITGLGDVRVALSANE